MFRVFVYLLLPVACLAQPTSYLITTVAGNGTAGFSGDGGTATSAQLNGPIFVALDASQNLYISDTLNNRIRKVSGGKISTFAGKGGAAEKAPFKPAVEDFYLTNPVARASAVMAECSRLASGQMLVAAE